MRKLYLALAIVLLGPLSISIVGAQPAERPGFAVLITIDGCRPDVLEQANTPNIDALVASGVKALRCVTVTPSYTPPTHASLFTGAKPEVHGYFSPGDEVRVETIFQVFEEAGLATALVDGKGGRIRGLEVGVSYFAGAVDYRAFVDGDLRAMGKLLEILEHSRPTFSFVLLPKVDQTGHAHGHQSQAYREAIEQADQAVGLLLDKLEELGILENTLVVITADHGMRGTTHGGASPEEVEIPLVIWGPGIKENATIEYAEITDIAPTITYAFGLEAPENAWGTPLHQVFEEPEPVPTIEPEVPLGYLGAAVGGIVVVALVIYAVKWRK